jgi:hypothetical protein
MSSKNKTSHLNNYDLVKTQTKYCSECHKKTKQKVYAGHTFAEGSNLVYCLNCKVLLLV